MTVLATFPLHLTPPVRCTWHFWPFTPCWHSFLTPFPCFPGVHQASLVMLPYRCLLLLDLLCVYCFTLDPLICLNTLPRLAIQSHSLIYCKNADESQIDVFSTDLSSELQTFISNYLLTWHLHLHVSLYLKLNMFQTEFLTPVQQNPYSFQLFISSIKSTRSLEVTLYSCLLLLAIHFSPSPLIPL